MRSLHLAPADALRLALLAALGLPAFTACGGTIQTKDEASSDGGTTGHTGGGRATGGNDGTGSWTSTGGAIGVGGAIGTGGVTTANCTNPEPHMPGYDTGFYWCAEGYEHRAEVKVCPSFLPRAEPQPQSTGGASAVDECVYDSDCPGANAYCTRQGGNWGELPYPAGTVCATGCTSDSDCLAGQICHCSDPIGYCASTAGANGGAGCTTDADCEGNSLCAYVPQHGCGSGVVFACQTAADECVTSADCMENGFQDCSLSWEGTGQRLCQGAPVCGRPFLVDFLERRADAAERSDWTLSARVPRLAELGAAERARLAAHWTDIALMEHASIAAFARFSLQLLSLGAPADLIEETNRALVDETKHARLCFALASSYRGAPVGPGGLAVDGSLTGDSPEMILRTVIREGCLGETQAALEAAEARAACEDPAVAEVLAVIAQDEARHAELAWRFVQWLLDERPELRSVAREEFSGALGTFASTPQGEAGESLRRHGVLDAAAREAVRQRALTAVLAPCAESLLAARGRDEQPRFAARPSRSDALEALS